MKSFASRLAALEQQEQQEQEQEAAHADVPNVALLRDDEVAFYATIGMRDCNLTVELSAPLGPVRLARRTWGTSDAWHQFWTALVPRANALLDGLERPIVFLADWEIDDAIAAIDAGRCIVSHHYRMIDGTYTPSSHALFDSRFEGYELRVTLHAVTHAAYLEAQQRRYPERVMDVGMTTLTEWRAWLVEQRGPA